MTPAAQGRATAVTAAASAGRERRATPAADRRAAFYAARFPEFWATVEGHEYALFEPLVLPAAEVSALRAAAAAAWRIYARVAPLIRALPDQTLRELGIPPPALAACRIPPPADAESIVARFDFIRTPGGFRMIELNAETPFFLWESFAISGAVARAHGLRDPNAGCVAHVHAAFRRCIGDGLPAGSRIAVAAYNAYREDRFTAQFVRDELARALERDVTFVPIHTLHMAGGELRDDHGRIDVLYRLYPLEHFAADRDGPAFFDAIVSDRVRIVNPPSAFVLQSKMTQVLIWGLAESGAYFDAADAASIRALMLPTFAELPDDGHDYVEKPVFGREGNSVRILRHGAAVAASLRSDYAQQPMVYQQRVVPPLVRYQHPRLGASEGFGIHTCFVVDGVASAIGLRIGTEITDAWAYFQPLAEGA